MATKIPKRKRASLEDRFDFIGDAVAPGDRSVLKPAIFEVEERHSGLERSLKLWRKTATALDEDLRQLWLHEMRQIQRLMSYAGARDVIVDVLEFVEDDEDFGVVLERVGQPLTQKRKRAGRQHWLRNLNAPRARILFWRNAKRLVQALGIIHAQGLVHGRIGMDVVMTDGDNEPDFRLSGFEWSLWLGADLSDRSHAKVGPAAARHRTNSYSFADDWQALGYLLAECLDSIVKASGDVYPAGHGDSEIILSVPERMLLKRLVTPARMDQLDAHSINRAIDDLIVSVAQFSSARAGTFVVFFDQRAKLAEAVYEATEGEISIDDVPRQLDWVRADLDGGVTLIVPADFGPANGGLKLVTNDMVYQLRAYLEDDSRVWDIAVCQLAEIRGGVFKLGAHEEHALMQPIRLARNARDAMEMRGRLGPDALDWSVFATPQVDSGPLQASDVIRRSLLLVQMIEALVKAMEVYPVEILETEHKHGRRIALLRAAPDNKRDRIATRVGLADSVSALKRLFEDDYRDAGAKWRLCQASSLGGTRISDVAASFVDVNDSDGRRAYLFEIDDRLPEGDRFFLRVEQDVGTEQVIARRLRNIKALDTRIDLAEMLADPWRVRRSSREGLSDEARQDDAFLDLDAPKQEALVGLWSTLPSYFVVGPPGVGKTKLATEVVRRRFETDPSTRMLISAQGHDALDNLQEKVRETLGDAGLADVLVVRSTTSQARLTSDEEVHRTGLDYLERLSHSTLAQNAPEPIRARILELKEAASRIELAKDTVDKEQRSGLRAVSHLVLDSANIVITTANSLDIERLVEDREQFDWVVVEEAAKATGPEIIGPLMLSGRRLLIGDHHQLPPFDSDRLVKILSDHSLVSEAILVADELVGPLFRDGELDELGLLAKDPTGLKDSANMALRLLEPFRTFVEDDERRALANPGHRSITATLTEQRRMDPAIAEIVSKSFYHGRLVTESGRAYEAQTKASPVIHLGALPSSPVVIVDFPHVSATGKSAGMERERPRWHNPAEVSSVIDVLRLLRTRNTDKPSSLAILSPYKAQVDKLQMQIDSEMTRKLSHLSQFVSVRSDGKFVGTVDSFQGSEADVVILSLVRNNPRSGGGALGFLRDRRRMNVALSRAKSHLIIVGSLDFLKEAVRGVNPDAESHDLSFLTEIINSIQELATRQRNDVPLAAFVAPSALQVPA